jgi:hypothetical protein
MFRGYEPADHGIKLGTRIPGMIEVGTGVLEHLDAAHRGQRHPKIAVDRPDLLGRAQVQHQRVGLDLQLGPP